MKPRECQILGCTAPARTRFTVYNAMTKKTETDFLCHHHTEQSRGMHEVAASRVLIPHLKPRVSIEELSPVRVFEERPDGTKKELTALK